MRPGLPDSRVHILHPVPGVDVDREPGIRPITKIHCALLIHFIILISGGQW